MVGSGAVDDLSWCVPGSNLENAGVSPRNGTGVNPVALTSWSLPVVGGTWVTGLDCRGHASGQAFVGVFRATSAPVATPLGEVLVGGAQVFLLNLPHSSTVSFFNVELPRNVALCGLRLHVQGACTGRPGPRLSNALDFTIGF